MKWCWSMIVLTLFLGSVGIVHEIRPVWAEETDQSWVSKVVSLQGNVVVKRSGESDWRPIALEDTLFAGDQIRVDANSRAGIVLRNDAVIRLNQNTTLVFTEIEEETTFILRLLKGAANFFSRRPRSLKFLTPFVNGVVEGTEFYVQVEADRTRIDLFEGRLLATNPYGEVQLSRGQGVTAMAGSAPQRRLLVKPRDSVQWALYYPFVLALPQEDIPDEFQAVLKSIRQGRWLEALEELDLIAENRRNSGFYAFRAALYLHLGSISEARNNLRQALALDAENSEALALQVVMAVVQNRKEEAMEIAQKTVQQDPDSAAGQMALSYAYQAAFDLGNALKAARAAVARVPENGIVHARMAELYLSTGKIDEGVQSAQKAVGRNPNSSHANAMLGFAYLTRININKAREAFEKAIELDSAAPLPRLGLGLAEIRDGNLAQGRAEIEIAAGLDPLNALIRSYLGKAYFDEKRGPLDETQFKIAKSLDPKDPTPWFYDAIRKQTLNRPVEALHDLQKSIELNDNRAVYRSRLLLDEDLAARSAGLARIYGDLSFKQLALIEGWKAVNTNYSEYSGHRFLADSYSMLSRHEIARVSELLQSKLLQPINITPIHPRISEYELLIPENAGPARTSFNEFNPLFASDAIKAQASVIAGNNGTAADDLAISGLYKNYSLSVGQFHYETDGFRENNDLTYNIYNAFTQIAFSEKAGVQMEFRSREADRGDLRMLFDPDFFARDKRTEEKQKSLRIGGNLRLRPQNNFIVSLVHSELDKHITDRAESITPFFQFVSEQDISADTEASSGELQYIGRTEKYEMIAGGGYIDRKQKLKTLIVNTTTTPPLDPTTETIFSNKETDKDYSNMYVYTHLRVIKNLIWTLGASYDSFKIGEDRDDKMNWKSGFIWSPHHTIAIRGAWFQNVKRPFVVNETLEPTQVAGFNQLFDDDDGSVAQRYGAAVDANLFARVFAGIEFTWRDIEVPSYEDTTGITSFEDQREQAHRAYLHWAPTEELALSMEAFAEEFERSIRDPKKLTTYKYPFGINLHFSNGIYANTLVTLVSQELTRNVDKQKDDFIVVDLSIGFRLPKRFGTITFSAKNIFDEEFNFQDYNFNADEPLTPQYVPDRLWFAQVNIAL